MSSPMLYEICPACKGTGVLMGPIRVVHAGKTTTHQSYPCPACKQLHVVAIGVTSGQLGRMVRRETIEAEQLAGYDRASRTVKKGGA